MRIPGITDHFSGLRRRQSGVQAKVHVPGITGGGSTATPYGPGGGPVSIIKEGPLAGSPAGGGTRDQVYGTWFYGSIKADLPHSVTYGFSSFPFYFWPVVWTPTSESGYDESILYRTYKFGHSDDTDRPGGLLVQANFTSPTSNSTFQILSDNTTVSSLIPNIQLNCALGPNSTIAPSMVNFYDDRVVDSSQPRPEKVVQYYRTSSVALMLEGYNNTIVLSEDLGPVVPLPGWLDETTLQCLNMTIGEAVLLMDAGSRTRVSVGTLGLLWILVSLVIG